MYHSSFRRVGERIRWPKASKRKGILRRKLLSILELNPQQELVRLDRPHGISYSAYNKEVLRMQEQIKAVQDRKDFITFGELNWDKDQKPKKKEVVIKKEISIEERSIGHLLLLSYFQWLMW